MSRRGGGPGGRPSFAARRDIPQADKVDTLRDALYPRRVFYNRHGLPRSSPWTVAEVAELTGTTTAALAEASDEAHPGSVSRAMSVQAGFAPPGAPQAMADWGAWLPQELLESGPIKAKKRRRVPKPSRRGGTVVMPEVEVARGKKVARAEGGAAAGGANADGDGSGSGSGSDSDGNDDALSGAGGSDDAESGGSGDELTM